MWTTGSWLVYECLEQASREERIRMEDAILAGDIAWHGMPFTTHSELMDPSLFAYGLSLSQRLDERFGRRTIAAKMTDVPGHTRAIVPLLADAGMKYLHIGVNFASKPPDVPPVFVWRSGGSEVIVHYDKGGYGGTRTVEGLSEALSFAHTADNNGPQAVDKIVEVFSHVRESFPGAEAVASTMDSFAGALLAVRDTLPVIESEIADTWIHGVGTDPGKVAQFRELSRLRARTLADNPDVACDPAFDKFSRSLLMVPEHTWGLDVKTHLDDWENYGAVEFALARSRDNFNKMEASWAEQRAYVTEAVDALGGSLLGLQARQAIDNLVPTRPSHEGMTRLEEPARFDAKGFEIGFDPKNGAVSHLVDTNTGRALATPEHLLGMFTYQTFSQQDYDRFTQQYLLLIDWIIPWAIPDFSKPGMDKAKAESRVWSMSLAGVYCRKLGDATTFLVELDGPQEAVEKYGCPKTVTVEITVSIDPTAITFDLKWFDKQACRLPEACWFSFHPAVGEGEWLMDKMGQMVSPIDVIADGNRKLHAVGTGVINGTLAIDTVDAPLVAFDKPSLLDFNNTLPDSGKGVHVNLHNNVWGTNFPMWYEEDARFRFKLRDNK